MSDSMFLFAAHLLSFKKTHMVLPSLCKPSVHTAVDLWPGIDSVCSSTEVNRGGLFYTSFRCRRRNHRESWRWM